MKQKVHIEVVRPHQVDVVWPLIEEWVERGLRHGQGDESTPEQLKNTVVTGDNLLWIAVIGDRLQAALFVAVQDTNVRKLFVDMLVGENMDTWIDAMQSKLVTFKDLMGATCIESSCRPGLAKYLRKLGWKPKATIMSFE